MRKALGKIIASLHRPLVTGSIVLTVVLGIGNYFLRQYRLEVAQRHDAVVQRGEGIVGALSENQHINSDLVRLQQALEVIDRNLVVEADMEVNLGYFYKLEKLHHVRFVQLNQLSSAPSPDGNPFKTIPISLRATGTYVQLMNFLRQLETGPRLLTIRGFSFARSDPKSDALSLDLTVDMLAKQ